MFAFPHPCGQTMVGQDHDWVDLAPLWSRVCLTALSGRIPSAQSGTERQKCHNSKLQSMSMISIATSAMRLEQNFHIFSFFSQSA